MRAVSNVVAAMVLIGITIVGFAIAYPVFFAKAHGLSGSGNLLDMEAEDRGVKLVLIDYTITRNDGSYEVKLWIYNAGWATARIMKAMTPNGYAEDLSTIVKPGETVQVVVNVPGYYGEPSRIILVTEYKPFIFSLR